MIVVTCLGCDPTVVTQLGMVTADDLAGTYTGILEGVTVSNLDDVGDPQRQVIVDLDLLHQLTIRAAGTLTLTIQSNVIPPLRAIVVGSGPVAINAEFVEFEELDVSNGEIQFDAVKVKQIVFVQYQGEWIVVLQLVRAQVEPQQSVNEVYAYQYVSYPSNVAAQMSEEQAIVYVNTILRLLSAAQRS
ncbi:MAG: hypothetical protein ACREMI_12625 [Gemmatimonadales bacterium]